MNCKKIRIFAIFSLFLSFFTAFSAVSFAGDDYNVEQITVGAESKDPAMARVKAFSKARKIALEQVFKRLGEDIDISDVEDRDISDLVSQERVSDEVISGNSYSGTIDIGFSEDFVQRFIKSRNREMKDKKKAKELGFLVIPVLMENGKVIIWENNNLWRLGLKKAIKDEGVSNFQIIEGDIFNLSVINSSNILRVEPRLISELFDKYKVDFIYIAFFSYSDQDSKAKLAINGFTKRDQFQYRLSFRNSDNLEGGEVKNQVASKLIEYLSNNSLARAEENNEEGADLVRLEIPVRRLSQWLYVESKLKNNDFVTNLDVKSVSKDFIKVDVECKDSLDIVNKFAKIGFDLTYRSQGTYLMTIK